MLNYYVVYGFLIVGSAAVFTSLFYQTNYNFPNFSMSIRFLYTGALMYTDFWAFTEHIAFGSILYGIYLLASAIMLLNLMIAMLFNVYGQLIT